MNIRIEKNDFRIRVSLDEASVLHKDRILRDLMCFLQLSVELELSISSKTAAQAVFVKNVNEDQIFVQIHITEIDLNELLRNAVREGAKKNDLVLSFQVLGNQRISKCIIEIDAFTIKKKPLVSG